MVRSLDARFCWRDSARKDWRRRCVWQPELKIGAPRLTFEWMPQFRVGGTVQRDSSGGLLNHWPTFHPTIRSRSLGEGLEAWLPAALGSLHAVVACLACFSSSPWSVAVGLTQRKPGQLSGPAVQGTGHPGWAGSVWSVDGCRRSGRLLADVNVAAAPAFQASIRKTGRVPPSPSISSGCYTG